MVIHLRILHEVQDTFNLMVLQYIHVFFWIWMWTDKNVGGANLFDVEFIYKISIGFVSLTIDDKYLICNLLKIESFIFIT